jgi:hypothetical protein
MDGHIICAQFAGTTWSFLRDNVGCGDIGFAHQSATLLNVSLVTHPSASPLWRQIGRTFLTFDFSDILPGSIITEVRLTFDTGAKDTDIPGCGIAPYEAVLISNIVLYCADFDCGGETPLATPKDLDTQIPAYGQAIWDFNDDGIKYVQDALINNGGIIRICMRESTYDAGDTQPAYPGTDKTSKIQFDSADGSPAPELRLTYIGGNDVTEYILGARSERGRDEELGQAQTGVLDLTCDNFIGAFNPENTSSPLYGLLDLGVVVTLYEDYEGNRYNHFTGKIDRIIPHDEPHAAIAVIKVLDGMDDLAGTEVVTPMRTDTDVGVLVNDVLDAAEWPSANRDIDSGIDTLQLGWFHRIKALDALRELERVEFGYIYMDVDGKVVFENRHHRVTGDGLVSQHDFEDTAIDIGYEFSKRFLRNEITVKGKRYFVGGTMILPGYELGETEDELIWSSHAGDEGAPYIPQNSTVTVWADMSSPIYSYNTLVRGEHWDANTAADKTGTDLGANVSIAETQYGQTIKLAITNNNAEGVYIVVPDSPPLGAPENRTLLVYGTLYMLEDYSITEKDQDSIDQYGKRNLTIDTKFKANPNDILAYAQYLLAKYKNPVPLAIHVDHEAMTGWPDDTIKLQCLSRRISDRITIKSTLLNIDQDYYINKVIQEYTRFEGAFAQKTTWLVERTIGGMAEGRYWLLGVVDYGELGENTILGF